MDFNYGNLSSLTKRSNNNIIKLVIYERKCFVPSSFISKFSNLQELEFSFDHYIEVLKILRHVIFPEFVILKFKEECPKHEDLTIYLENYGKNLKVLHLGVNNDSLNLAIAKFCPNLKTLYMVFKDDEIDTLKIILNGCQQLESIKVWCGDFYLNETELLEVVAKCSSKKFYELKIYFICRVYGPELEFFSEELEPVFVSWADRIPQEPLSLIIVDCPTYIRVKKESIMVIEKFKKLGVIKKFEYFYSDKKKKE